MRRHSIDNNQDPNLIKYKQSSRELVGGINSLRSRDFFFAVFKVRGQIALDYNSNIRRWNK